MMENVKYICHFNSPSSPTFGRISVLCLLQIFMIFLSQRSMGIAKIVSRRGGGSREFAYTPAVKAVLLRSLLTFFAFRTEIYRFVKNNCNFYKYFVHFLIFGFRFLRKTPGWKMLFFLPRPAHRLWEGGGTMLLF